VDGENASFFGEVANEEVLLYRMPMGGEITFSPF